MPLSVLWFRRDLRLGDNPALLAASDAGPGGVLPLFVLDPTLWEPAGPTRRAYLVRSLRALDDALDGRLHVRRGDPAAVVAQVASELGAATVHVASDHGPYGAERDRRVEAALAGEGRALVRTGSPYAVTPGRVRTGTGMPYRVFTPFARAWAAHGWRPPALSDARSARWHDRGGAVPLPAADAPDVMRIPPAGEEPALARWSAFVADGLDAYIDRRDRPDLAGTSSLSAALRWGEIHPRTLLAGLGADRAHVVFRRELAWREFYADVLHHAPWSAREDLYGPAAPHDDHGDELARERLARWCAGRTGYPFVDAGMRQLRAEGWVHNRVRMVVASFLVKDLHVDWRHGARWFMRWLRDGDLASNQHGWQWVAGTGTDAAPYHRVLNPVTQGLRHDPAGDYVRRYVPELRGVAGAHVHQPWDMARGLPRGYPQRVVDHATERGVALAARPVRRAR